ncbi:MAG: type II secretion system protein [Pseudomonadota bacterium]
MQTHALKTQGFTLLELVMVIVIISALSVVVTVRFGSTGEQTVSFQADQLVNQIRHMQGLAMTWGVPLRMNVTATGYNVQCVIATTTAPCNAIPVRDPAANQAFNVTLQDNVSLSGTNLEIDSLGRPRDAATHAVLGTSQVISLTIGTVTWNLTISPITADLILTKV